MFNLSGDFRYLYFFSLIDSGLKETKMFSDIANSIAVKLDAFKKIRYIKVSFLELLTKVKIYFNHQQS